MTTDLMHEAAYQFMDAYLRFLAGRKFDTSPESSNVLFGVSIAACISQAFEAKQIDDDRREAIRELFKFHAEHEGEK